MKIDAPFLQRVLSYDPVALVEVYDQLSPGIYRYAMRLLGDTDLAEECVAETFQRFLGGLRNGTGPDLYLQAYLYRIAHNWITDYYRRQPPPMLPLEEDLLSQQDREPERVATEHMERERVRSALALLTPEQRQVIVLRFLEDLPNEEIALTIQKPIGAIKALQHRALASLRRLLMREQKEIL